MLCSYGKKTIQCAEISPVNKRDLGTRENFSSRHMDAVELFIIFITRRDLACKVVEMFSR